MHLSDDIINDLERFTKSTALAWVEDGLVKPNSYGVVVVASEQPGNFDDTHSYRFGWTKTSAEHDMDWYIENALGKTLICQQSGKDSHEATRLWQGTLIGLEGAFAWGGAIIDIDYGLIIGTSGFKEDEDILFSRSVRNRCVMLLDREGKALLDDARQRGEQQGDAGANRFTRV
jgi:hypothetical protein